jgi:hypothetical protein
MFGHEHSFFSFIVICTYFICSTPSEVHLNMCALYEKNDQEKLKEPKNERCTIFLNVFPLFLKF